jgi:hypothetical protein
MNLKVHFVRSCTWLNLATATLVTLLQRVPVERCLSVAEDCIASCPAGSLIRFVAIGAASLGTIDSVAGATLLASTLTTEPTGPLPPFNATVGVAITPIGFTIANLIAIGSWKIGGDIPPGLILTTVQPNGGTVINGGGNLDATTPDNALTTPILEGTPTIAGTYTITFQGFWKGGESGGPFGGKGVSSVFTFTVLVAGSAPIFSTQPISVTVTGGTVALDAASNTGTYQWMLNGTTPIAGATRSTLVLSDAASSVGSYTCVATNAIGSTTSNAATVSLTTTADVGRLVNISSRSRVGTGQNILIAGFVIGGAGASGSESLLIRGSGPALDKFAVANTLPDPDLSLFSGSGVLLGSNAGWAGDAKISGTAAAVGAFPWDLPPGKDAALLETLPAGAYTAQIAGASEDPGISLAEIYDATPAGTYTLRTPRIVNISARALVGTGGDILIAGFSVGGSTARTVLVRASGPALVPFGVNQTLPDPQLQIYSGAEVLATNSGWGGDSQISAAASSVSAFAWGSPTSNDSALLITLPPGPYTAQVAGAIGDTGIALVEIYEVP